MAAASCRRTSSGVGIHDPAQNDKGLLPLSKSTSNIAVIGPNANVARYGDYEKEENGLHMSLLDGLRYEVPAAGIELDDGKDIDAAVSKAKQADVVILRFGDPQAISAQCFDPPIPHSPANPS